MNLARKERLAVRDDTPDARDTRDPNHIWLRQSVTFSVNGQTRTLELALPLRPGATPEEVDALLDEADAGMRRLSRRLDAHLAEVTGASPVIATPAAIHEAPPAPSPAESRTPSTTTTAPQAPETHAAPETHETPAAPPRPASAERPAAHPAPHPATSAPTRAAAKSAPTASTAPAAPTGGPTGGPDLTRPQFLAAAGELGLDARTVMERLNVRSLNGLNLREALDLLRRQLVREGAAEPQPPSAAAPASDTALPTPSDAPRFDEEDDGLNFELSYPDPDDLPSDDDFTSEDDFAPLEAAPPAYPAHPAHPAPSGAAPSATLSDVPDLDDLLGGATTPAEDPATVRAREIIASLRAAHPGGQPTEQQRRAYRNIVVEELGEAKATSIARAIWSVTPDKLGPEQFDALNRWGKEETFADEVEHVLALLRAEWLAQQATQQATQQAAQPPATQPAAQPRRPAADAARTPAQTSGQRPATRSRPATQPRSNAGSNAGGARDGAGSQGGA